jgi:hypothetical protein
MCHLWLVKLEECGENFQILRTASLQILCNCSHGRSSTLVADNFFFHFLTIMKFHYNEFILVARMISLYWHFTVVTLILKTCFLT